MWWSVVHADIVAEQAFEHGNEHGHLLGDVPALLIIAIVLAVPMPKGKAAAAA